MRTTQTAGCIVLVALFGACGGSGSDATPAPDGGGPIGTGGVDSGAPTPPGIDSGTLTPPGPDARNDASATVDTCTAGEKVCTGYASRRYCGAGPTGLHFIDDTCAANSGCVNGACVQNQCSDECTLGDVSGGKTCGLYDIAAGTWPAVDPVASLSDRARAYTMWLKNKGLTNGGVGSPHYSDPGTYANVDLMNGIGDSALWTGTYLAAEALRLKATGASDAHAHVLSTTDTLHLFFNVAGDPGLLARFAFPSGTPAPYTIPDLNCADSRVHCNTPYAGKNYDVIGKISRDQYQGVVLGYALAYEALGEEDAAAKAIIRDDVVELVKELMRERQVPMKLTYQGLSLPVKTLTLRFVVTSAIEMNNGAIDFDLTGSGDKAASMSGFQEFTPDLADLVSQIIPFTPPIPRASSAIMLASFFRVALMVTDGIAASKPDHDAILDYYLHHSGKGGNVADWLDIAKKWTGDPKCGDAYYGNNITMEPLYNLARLEDDPARQAIVRSAVLDQLMWPEYVNTKNPFFSFIYASNFAGASPEVVSSAAVQLAQFPAPPNVRRPVDLRLDPKYLPHEAACTDQVSHATAVDVGERVVGDFLWQRAPWSLLDGGDLQQTEPGVDYLVAYWMGRRHAFIADDAPAKCLRWH